MVKGEGGREEGVVVERSELKGKLRVMKVGGRGSQDSFPIDSSLLMGLILN